MASLEQIDEKLDRVENLVIELKTVLLGKNSDKGLVGLVNEHNKKINRIAIFLALLLGSGILGGGITGLIKLLG